MAKIIVGYGEYTNYRISELPDLFLAELAQRYPLSLGDDDNPDHDVLLITVGIHAEFSRRFLGASADPHVPSLRELALEIVSKGFQQVSKARHPDRHGSHDTQVRLAEARDELRNLCGQLPNTIDDSSIVIFETSERGPIRSSNSAIFDSDVPF